MAQTSVRRLDELEGLFVLAPERYDPRRDSLQSSFDSSVLLRRLVDLNRSIITNRDQPGRKCIVLDTSDAQEGIITSRKQAATVGDIGSAKKIIQPNDVIISRLRPYLRQVAFVDANVRHSEEDGLMVCSTEFFVLRPGDNQSIAFLVPFLLSKPVQSVLAASQEGGHHPRFNEAALLGLPVPVAFLKQREEISQKTEHSIQLFRESERQIMEMISMADASFSG